MRLGASSDFAQLVWSGKVTQEQQIELARLRHRTLRNLDCRKVVKVNSLMVHIQTSAMGTCVEILQQCQGALPDFAKLGISDRAASIS